MPIYNKLIRDKIPEIIRQDGKNFITRILSDEEYKEELLKKIVEESEEVLTTRGDHKELVKEIGDVLEVIDYIKKVFGLTDQEIENLKSERKEKRGGFDGKIFLESSD